MGKENAKSTPGPWGADELSVINLEGNRLVVPAIGVPASVAKANARLISLAPDMLALLDWIQDAYRTGNSPDEEHAILERASEQARALLAKLA